MLLIYTIIYALGTILYYLKLNVIASGLIVSLAIFLYVKEVKSNHRIINVKGIFALGFLGGYGISLLKLSKLSSDYSLLTVLVIYITYFSLYLGSFFAKNQKERFVDGIDKRINVSTIDNNKLTIINLVLIAVTFLSFVIEAMTLKFIPVFTKDTPHAYSTFHVHMIHYVTTLYIFIPSIAISNYLSLKNKKNVVFIIISFFYVLILSTLMLSRGQLIMSVILSVFTLVIHKGVPKLKTVAFYKKMIALIIIVILFLLCVFITIHRAHDVEYLNGIFEMKNKNLPIYVSQPYMYVAHNYENLNYMIENLTHHTFGRLSFTPLFTLTFAKNLFPFTIGAPPLLIKEELSTKTFIYDAYQDFGIVGVLILMIFVGYIGEILENYVYDCIEKKSYYRNNYIVILLALFSYYMLFSFLQSYMSLTDTWVNFIFVILLCFLPISHSVVKNSDK